MLYMSGLGAEWEYLMMLCRKCYNAMQQRYFQFWLNCGRVDFVGKEGFKGPIPHQMLVTAETKAAKENTHTKCFCEGRGREDTIILLIQTLSSYGFIEHTKLKKCTLKK